MGWQTLTPRPVRPPLSRSGMRISLAKNRAHVPPRLGITLTDAMARRLRLAEDGAVAVEVAVGDGALRGWLRFRRSDTGRFYFAPHRTRLGRVLYFRMIVGQVEGFPDRTEAARDVQWTLMPDGWVEVRLPGWALETKRPTASSIEAGLPAPGRSAFDRRTA